MDETRPETWTRFGPYLLKRLIGSGGMGSVYEAQDTVMDRVVALKLISGAYAQDPEYRQRLQREARIAGRLQDPHVVPVHAAGEIDGQLYVDMRLINGTDLDTLLQRSGRLPPAKAVSIVRQIASALDAAHAAGVMHRDVKPGNILVTADDFAYLVDFGIANAATEQKLTQMGDVLGTWAYMAPERFLGDPTQVTAQADTYALACVLFEAVAGELPFSGDHTSLVGAHLTQPVPRISSRTGLPPALDDVLARGMAKRPDERYATSGEFARAAEAALAPLGATTATFPQPPVAIPPATPVNVARAPSVPMQNAAPYWGPPTGPLAGYGAPGGAAGPPTGPAWPQPAPARGNRLGWILAAVAVVLVVAVAAGFGIWRLTATKSASSSQSSPHFDTSKLDVGRYGTKPRPVPGPTTKDEGRNLAAFRLAEGIADPYDVDPLLDHVYGFPAPNAQTAATTISGTGTPLTQPVLEKYGMITAYIVEALSKRFADFARDKSGESLLLMVTSFPNDDAAARAAIDMDATDFAVNPDNKKTTIPGYPDAKAHYRPGSPSIGVTMASGYFVMSILVRSDSKPDLDSLIQRVQRTLDRQKPLVDKLIPVLDASLTSLPLDPDNMLSRLFVAGDVPQVSDTFGSMGPRAAAMCANSQSRKDGLYKQAGIDRCAFSKDSQLLRTKDETAATTILPKLIEADRAEFVDHDLAPPDGIKNARCIEQKQKLWADDANIRFVCSVTFGRYIASVWSNEELDARQRAAAQFAILANSA
jgi:predicted Ser/Thr protein kinase